MQAIRLCQQAGFWIYGADIRGRRLEQLAFAGRVFDEPAWIEAAESATAFIHLRMRTADGRLLHRYRAGSAGIPGFLDDYVLLTAAHLELYDATFDAGHLQLAVELQRRTVDLFHDPKHGGFCLETEFYPDAVNRPEFPSCILRPGQVYHHVTRHVFSVVR